MSERVIKVWDLPVRLFHWLLLALVVAAVISVKIGGNAMEWHGRFGHLIVGLIVFRVVWGLIGSRTARFTSFVRGPGAIRDYLAGRWAGVGHSPLGALSALALLGLIAFQAGSGLFSHDDVAFSGPMAAMVSGDTVSWLSGWHRSTEWYIYGLVALHVAAVLFYSLVKKDRLVGPMITGRKAVPDDARYRENEGGGALRFIIALAIAVLALWATSGVFNPPPPPPPADLGW